MEKTKHGTVKDPFKVLPMTEKEKKLLLLNAVMTKVNELTNEAKTLEFEAKKKRHEIEYLRKLLTKPPAKKPAKKKAKPAKKPKEGTMKVDMSQVKEAAAANAAAQGTPS